MPTTANASTGADAACCARFYEQDWVRLLLGDSFHPGGVELSARLIQSMGLPPDVRVLDVACGVGTTARLMARQFELCPTGLDASEANLTVARDRSREEPVVPIEFMRGTANALPFPDGSFDAVVCECALSTFADQPSAAAEFARVLKPGGVIGLSDMAVEGELPDDLTRVLAPWTCVAGARSVIGYQRLFLDAGFRVVRYDDEPGALVKLAIDLKRKLLTVGVAELVGSASGLGFDLTTARGLLNRAQQLAADGTVQYCRMVFSKGRAAPVTTRQITPLPHSACCDPGTGCC